MVYRAAQSSTKYMQLPRRGRQPFSNTYNFPVVTTQSGIDAGLIVFHILMPQLLQDHPQNGEDAGIVFASCLFFDVRVFIKFKIKFRLASTQQGNKADISPFFIRARPGGGKVGALTKLRCPSWRQVKELTERQVKQIFSDTFLAIFIIINVLNLCARRMQKLKVKVKLKFSSGN